MAIGPIIYTGQNAGVQTQQPTQSLQALSQFSQQDYGRKKSEIEQSYKERDSFLSLLKTDPIYTANAELNRLAAKRIEEYTNTWSNKFKEGRGKLTTMDYADMMQEQSAMLAEQDYYKAIVQRQLQANEMYSRNPDKYNKRLLDEDNMALSNAFTQLAEGKLKVIPDDFNFLYPSYSDPLAIAQTYAKAYNPKEISGTTQTPNAEGGIDISGFKGYQITDADKEFIVEQTWNDADGRYSMVGKWEEANMDKAATMTDAEKEQAAYNAWKPIIKQSLWPMDRSSSNRVKNSGVVINLSNGGFTTEDGRVKFDKITTSEAGFGGEEVYRVSNADAITLPASSLNFDAKYKFPPDARVNVVPVIVGKNKTAFQVLSRGSAEYEYEDTNYESGASSRVVDGKRYFLHKVPIEDGTTVTGNNDLVLEDVGGSYFISDELKKRTQSLQDKPKIKL